MQKSMQKALGTGRDSLRYAPYWLRLRLRWQTVRPQTPNYMEDYFNALRILHPRAWPGDPYHYSFVISSEAWQSRFINVTSLIIILNVRLSWNYKITWQIQGYKYIDS